MSKQYGLLFPKKDKTLHPIGPVRPSIFGDDSDSDSSSAKPTGLKRALKRQDRLLQEKAMEEDPTVFQYDEVYDDIEAKRKESKLSRKDLDKKPKYINKLLQSAERRKRENERRIERQVQREREAEGDEFKDKESFVTTAYRTKLEELKKLDELEEREQYLEALGDVKRQGNLDGFYRHLYDQKVLYEDKVDTKAEKPKTEPKKRKYRKRDDNAESDPEASATPPRNLQHLPSNIDADSDFSIDSDSDDNSNEKNAKAEPITKPTETIVEAAEEKEVNEKADDTPKQEEEVKEEEDKLHPVIDIWKKRTIGNIFYEAQQKFYQRQAMRLIQF